MRVKCQVTLITLGKQSLWFTLALSFEQKTLGILQEPSWSGKVGTEKCGFPFLFDCLLQFFFSYRSSCSSVPRAPPASGTWVLDVPWPSLGYCFPSELFMCCSLVFAVGQMLKIRICLSNLYGSLQWMWFHCLPSPRALDRFSRPSDCGLCIHCCHKSQDFSFQYWHVKTRHSNFSRGNT